MVMMMETGKKMEQKPRSDCFMDFPISLFMASCFTQGFFGY